MEFDDDQDDYPRQMTVRASEASKLRIKGPVSVFALAIRPVSVKLKQDATDGVEVRVTRIDGAIRCERMAVQDTAEYQAATKERRSRQIPPRGNKIGWKVTRSKKLVTLKAGK